MAKKLDAEEFEVFEKFIKMKSKIYNLKINIIMKINYY